MRFVDDDRDESGGEMQFANQPVESTSVLHELFGARNHNTARPPDGIASNGIRKPSVFSIPHPA